MIHVNETIKLNESQLIKGDEYTSVSSSSPSSNTESKDEEELLSQEQTSFPKTY